MTITELITELESVRAEHGDIEIAERVEYGAPGDPEMLGIDRPVLRHWQYKEYKPGYKKRAFAATGTPILILGEYADD